MDDNKTYQYLTYAGTIPFIVCALLPLVGVSTIANVGDVDFIARLYGLAIVSFVAGSHWGTYLYNRMRCPANLFLVSNIVVLSAWFAFLLTGSVISIFVLILALLYLLFVDFSLYRVGITTADYFTTRLNVTVIVCAALTLSVLQLLGRFSG